MPSRSNKTQRSYGAPAYSPPSSSSSGRNKPREATPEERKAALAADRKATTAGAKENARNKKRVQQKPAATGNDSATQDLSALGAGNKIKAKKARDMDAIDKMSR